MDKTNENLLCAYSAAHYTVFFHGLRLEFCVGEITPGNLPIPMALITAWNPGRTTLSNAANRLANRKLRSDIKSLGLEYWRSLAEDPSGNYREPGFAVHAISETEAIRLGSRHRQLAVVYLDETGARLLQCCGRV